MHKIAAIIFVLSLLFNSLVFAHPPEDVIFNYDAKNRILSVGVAHTVENLQKHFIREITIKVNGKDWISQNFTRQTSLDAQAVGYAQVDLKKGDVIEVLAVCNQEGQLKKSFKVQ